MGWNWQSPKWPNFVWRPERLTAAEQAFIAGGGVFLGSVKHLGLEDKDELRVEAMSAEASGANAVRTSSQPTISLKRPPSRAANGAAGITGTGVTASTQTEADPAPDVCGAPLSDAATPS